MSKDVKSLHKLLVTNPQFLKIDLDSIPEKKFISFPHRTDDGTLEYLGNSYVPYTEGSLGWVSDILDDAVDGSGTPRSLVFSYVATTTLAKFGSQDDEKMAQSQAQIQAPCKVGSLLVFRGTTDSSAGLFHEVVVFSNKVLHSYAITEYARQARARFVWNSNMFFTLFQALQPALLLSAPDAAGSFFMSTQPAAKHLKVSRAKQAHKELDISLGEVAKESFCWNAFLDGLFPFFLSF